MQTTEFIARLKSECPLLKGKVFGAAELVVANPTTMQPPCAFVIPMSEKSSPNTLSQGFSQKVTVQFGVVIAIRNFNDTRGDAGHVQLELVRKQVKDALCNWDMTDTATPMEHIAGDLAGYDNLVLRWNDVFETNFYYRK